MIPKLSITVSDATEVPAVGNVTIPGLSTVLVVGVPDGKYHEYADTEPSASYAVAAKLTAWPARMVRLPVGAVIVPVGG